MQAGDKAKVTRGAYTDREVTLRKPHPDFPGFWKCALPIQKRKKLNGPMVDTDDATEVLLSEGQMQVVTK